MLKKEIFSILQWINELVNKPIADNQVYLNKEPYWHEEIYNYPNIGTVV